MQSLLRIPYPRGIPMYVRFSMACQFHLVSSQFAMEERLRRQMYSVRCWRSTRIVEISASPDHGFVVLEIVKGLFQIPGARGGQLTGQQRIQLLPGPSTRAAAAAQEGPAHMLEPLGGCLACGPQADALGAPHLIHRLIQVGRDRETVQHMQRLAGRRCERLRAWISE